MKTTIDIPDDFPTESIRLTKARTKREAVVGILRNNIRRRRMADLVRFAGSFPDDFPTNEEIEAVDLHAGRALHARSH